MKKLLSLITLITVAVKAFAVYDVTTTDRLRVWAVFPDKIIADGTTVNYITVYEHDDDNVQFCAFNMEFILPEGFSVNRVKKGRETVDDIFFSDRATSTHIISCNIVDGVDLRIIGDSSENANFYDDDEDGNLLDELFTIGLIADKSIPSGDYQITMEGIKFCLSNADARVPADEPIVYNVFIDNPDIPTGLTEIRGDELDPDECYSLSGLPVDPAKVHNMVIICNGNKYYVK